MAIITFKSNERKETGQTLSMAAVATQLAVEHNYKVLLVATSFQEQILENCFWDLNRLNAPKGGNLLQKTAVGIESGIEGLIKVLVSNRTSPEIVKNYSKIVLRDRLDVLLSPVTTDYKDYAGITASYPEILQLANRYYDLVFVDLSNRMPEQDNEAITQMSDVVVMNLTQRLKSIEDFVELRESNELYKKKNIMLLIGRYDTYSKYNTKNVTRYLREKQGIKAIPYNTLFFEACSEGKIVDFFLKLKNVTDETDRNYIFLKEVSKTANDIIYKLQELQMRNNSLR